jgi:S1-C subfamily serine protease
LVLTVAFASPQGAEARLDLVRFVGHQSEWSKGVLLEEFFQIDGTAWPGFTGAVVVDSEGRLVGFVAENKSGNGGFVVGGTDFARLAEALIRTGSPRQAWLGVSTRPAGGQGLALLRVDEDSPAEKAGWKAGDLLVSLAGKALKEPGELVGVLAGLQPEVEVAARLLRDGQVIDKPVVPGGR